MEEDEMGNERVREIITGARLKCEEENNKKNREILGNVKIMSVLDFRRRS